MEAVTKSNNWEPQTLNALQRRAEVARNTLKSDEKLDTARLVSLLEDLLTVWDLPQMQLVFQQLPPSAFHHTSIVSVFLRYLMHCGELSKANHFASRIRKSNPDLPENGLGPVIDAILTPLPQPDDMQSPQVVAYDFDLNDGHYSITMLVRCPSCGTDYIEKTGWGVMVLRPSFCVQCLHPTLINPEFLAQTMQRYHEHDGGRGFRTIDQEINTLLSEWHLDEDYPEEGYMTGINLAEPMMLRIQRLLVKWMYRERYLKHTEGER